MSQILTNFDAELIHGILRFPPNCAKLTKTEKKQVIALCWQDYNWLREQDRYTQQFDWTIVLLNKRKWGGPDLIIEVKVVKEQPNPTGVVRSMTKRVYDKAFHDNCEMAA